MTRTACGFASTVVEIAIANQQSSLEINTERLRAAVTKILTDADIHDATISVAVVDDATIHELNRRFLQHDYPTDVLSFVLERVKNRLEGEVIVSADYALRSAHEYRWSADDELLLYVIHGALHLAGHDDQDDESRAIMRQRERHYLLACGVNPPSEDR
jgi:probable rRNA maturation factor